MELDRTQVDDDLLLLELMLEDLQSAPAVFQPTNFWSVYEQPSVKELRRSGLRDFRRRKNSILSRYATDPGVSLGKIDITRSRPLYNRFSRRAPLWPALLSLLNLLLNKLLPIEPESTYHLTLDSLKERAYEFSKILGEKAGARSIDDFEASLIGNPEDILRVNGKVYTMPILFYYLQYVYCCAQIDFSSVHVLVELGSGSGRQVEVLKKLHPDICFLLFDIPPPLYVCQQYLATLFPGSVVSYRETREMKEIPKERKGKIFILGNWKFPILENERIDLFWNTASFQEMEPDVVANYLQLVNRRADAAYLREVMTGQGIAPTRGQPGVLQKTTLEDYKKGLSNFQLVDLSASQGPFGKTAHSDSFWKRA